MDRQHKRAERVNVYHSREAREQGHAPVRTHHTKPYSRAGLDYYEDAPGGTVRPGFLDPSDPAADACVYLTGPGSEVGCR